MISLQLFFLALGVAGSSFFSGAETGYITWNVLKVKHRAFSGDIVARWGVHLIRRRDQLISAILIGNNIANIGTSLAFVALYESLLPSLPAFFSRIPSPESWILTPFLLLVGEMLPKSLFRIYPFRFTIKVTPFMMLFYIITFPATALFSWVTALTRKRRTGSGGSYYSRVREEMVLIASEGSKTGSLFRSADQFMESFLLLDDKCVNDVLESSPPGFPVFSGDDTVDSIKMQMPDNADYLLILDDNNKITGYVVAEQLAGAEGSTRLKTLVKGTRKIGGDQSVLAALRSVTASHGRLFEVLDNDGKTTGFINMASLFRSVFSSFRTLS